jgi:hypothetical protein
MLAIQHIDGKKIIDLDKVWRIQELEEGDRYIIVYEHSETLRDWETFSSEETRDIRFAQIHSLLKVKEPLHDLKVAIAEDKI